MQKQRYVMTLFIFCSFGQLLAPDITVISCHLKLPQAHTLHLHKQQQSCQQLLQFHHSFCESTVYSKAVISQWLPTNYVQCFWFLFSDRFQFQPQLILTSFSYWQFLRFHSVCLLLSQLYSQYFAFSTSSCSCSQSTLNTITELWHCVKDCCCGMISDCW